MQTLAHLYLVAFNWLMDYVNEILNAFISGNVKIGGTGWLDFFYLGFTDLNTYLSFLFSVFLFIMVHYWTYRFIKYLFKVFSGVVNR